MEDGARLRPLCDGWTVRRLICYQSGLRVTQHFNLHILVNLFRRAKRVLVDACLMLCLFMMCLPVFKVPLHRNATDISPESGVGSVLSVAQKSDLLLFSYRELNLPLLLYVFFLCVPLHPVFPVHLFDWRSRGVKQC